MSLSNSSLKSFSLVILDNRYDTILYCKEHKKQLKSYRIVRSHFKTKHELTEKQFSKVSKIGRLLN